VRPLGRGREIAPGTIVAAHLHRSNALDVYDAWNEPRGCRVIAKTLRPDRLHKRGARARLVREGRLLLRLTHPHLVRAYEVHDVERPAIVVETLTGATVEHLAFDGGQPMRGVELANLGAHLASALRHLHAHGVLHCDLKPANVVAEHGRAKVIDLSHARPPGRMPPGNGTWCYMALEPVRGAWSTPPPMRGDWESCSSPPRSGPTPSLRSRRTWTSTTRSSTPACRSCGHAGRSSPAR